LDIQALQKFIQGIHHLTGREWFAFSFIWQPFSCKRTTILTAAEETERHLYFVTEGVQRSFYLTPKHEETTIIFTYRYSFSGIAYSFLIQTPSFYYLEAVTPANF